MKSSIGMIYLCNTLFRVAYVVCVTFAAISFNNPKLLIWWVLVLAMSLSYSSDNKDEKEPEEKEEEQLMGA